MKRQGDQSGWAVDYETTAAAQEQRCASCGTGRFVVLTFGRCAACATDRNTDSTQPPRAQLSSAATHTAWSVPTADSGQPRTSPVSGARRSASIGAMTLQLNSW